MKRTLSVSTLVAIPLCGLAVAASGFLAPYGSAGEPGRGTGPAARLVIENRTYSSLVISVLEAADRERRVGPVPPDFVNTLFVREPLPPGPVRLLARVTGEDEPLFRSDPVRLRSGAAIRWKLPSNALEDAVP